jgi:hypothetical protein
VRCSAALARPHLVPHMSTSAAWRGRLPADRQVVPTLPQRCAALLGGALAVGVARLEELVDPGLQEWESDQ